VAHYHVSKLLEMDLAKERDGAFVVEGIIFENLIRIRHSVIPIQTTFATFFATGLISLILTKSSFKFVSFYNYN
jgi:hypothetical protein